MEDNKADTGSAADSFAKDDAEFREIVTQRYMYNADKCKEAELVGHLLNLLPMPPILRSGKLRPWNAFLIRTTRPTKALDREKNVVDVAVGSEVLIPATFELSQFLTKAATNEDKIFEVKIRPDKKLDIGGGQELWQYKMGAKPKPERRGAFGLAAVLAPLQLASGTADGEGNGAGDDDTPW